MKKRWETIKFLENIKKLGVNIRNEEDTKYLRKN